MVTKNSKTFPNQFVGVRWLENRTVVEHLLSLLDDLKLFVDAVETKQVEDNKSRSYYMVSSHLKNIKLMREKLVFHVDCYGVGAVPDRVSEQ